MKKECIAVKKITNSYQLYEEQADRLETLSFRVLIALTFASILKKKTFSIIKLLSGKSV